MACCLTAPSHSLNQCRPMSTLNNEKKLFTQENAIIFCKMVTISAQCCDCLCFRSFIRCFYFGKRSGSYSKSTMERSPLLNKYTLEWHPRSGEASVFIKHVKAVTEWPTFYRCHFQINFLILKLLYVNFKNVANGQIDDIPASVCLAKWFSALKLSVSQFEHHGNLFLRVKLTINQHFNNLALNCKWLGSEQASSDYPKQYWPSEDTSLPLKYKQGYLTSSCG